MSNIPITPVLDDQEADVDNARAAESLRVSIAHNHSLHVRAARRAKALPPLASLVALGALTAVVAAAVGTIFGSRRRSNPWYRMLRMLPWIRG